MAGREGGEETTKVMLELELVAYDRKCHHEMLFGKRLRLVSEGDESRSNGYRLSSRLSQSRLNELLLISIPNFLMVILSASD